MKTIEGVPTFEEGEGELVPVRLGWTPIVDRIIMRKGDKYAVVEETLWYGMDSPYPKRRDLVEIDVYEDGDECANAIAGWILDKEEGW